jgi:hypothetical protein
MAMIPKTRRRMLAGCDGQTLVCASLFSVAALICALGNGALGLVVFFLGALLADWVVSRRRESCIQYRGVTL